jgi:hypothetical protein
MSKIEVCIGRLGGRRSKWRIELWWHYNGRDRIFMSLSGWARKEDAQKAASEFLQDTKTILQERLALRYRHAPWQWVIIWHGYFIRGTCHKTRELCKASARRFIRAVERDGFKLA